MINTLIALLIAVAVMIARTHWMTDVLASVFFGVPLLWVTLRVGFTKPRSLPRPWHLAREDVAGRER